MEIFTIRKKLHAVCKLIVSSEVWHMLHAVGAAAAISRIAIAIARRFELNNELDVCSTPRHIIIFIIILSLLFAFSLTLHQQVWHFWYSK